MTYLEMLRSRYAAHRAAIEEIQNRAVADSARDFTPDELTSITESRAAAELLVPQIEAAAAEQARNAAVDLAAGAVADSIAAAAAAAPPALGAQGPAQGRAAAGGPGHVAGAASVGTTTATDRDPGTYTRNSQYAFFTDMQRSRDGDHEARERLEVHNRALSTGASGAGLVAPVWLTQEYETIARQGRVVAEGVRHIPLGMNPSPLTLPRQTTGTDAVVAQQATENTSVTGTDAYASTTDIVTPKPISGAQTFSRQMLDMSDPRIDGLIYADLTAVYNRKIEDLVTAGIAAAAGAAVATFATEAAFTGVPPAVPASDAITDAAIAVWNARKLPATQIAMRVSRWGKFNKLRDTTGRKLYPLSDAGPMNVDGVGSVEAAGSIEGLPVLASDGLGIGGATYPDAIYVYRASDVILFEGDMMRFSYEQPTGPESVRIGIWAYSAMIVRQAANSVRRIIITAA